jgi:hypothetical protein
MPNSPGSGLTSYPPGRTGAGAPAPEAAMKRLRRIKILATLGPASSDGAMIRRLFQPAPTSPSI